MLRGLKSFIKKHLVVRQVTAAITPVYQGQLLKNKVALIIGGSGGIGAEIAKAYANNGCRVVITGTNANRMESICKEIGPEKARYLVGDLKDLENIKAFIKQTDQAFGTIDILVHCAGLHCHEKFLNVSEQLWDSVMAVNLKSMYFACQLVANYMIEKGIKGHILNVSSASCAKPGWTPYEISKNGVRALTLGFADKLVKNGIIVNSIAPGPVATPMLGKQGIEELAWAGNPTGRMATPQEIANWAVFLVSSMGDLVVGDTFFVSGGSGTVCLNK